MKRALVIEGGGFRAAYAAGALYCLLRERPDLRFDLVAVNSSSVCNAAFFVTGQIEEMEALWKNDTLASPKLMSWWRAPISFYKSFLDIDYLFDDVFMKQHPLDLEKLRRAETEFRVTVMRYPDGARRSFSNRDPEIYEAMRASCCLPFAHIGKVFLRGERYIDGFYDSVPLRLAREKQCDDIWVISTRPRGYRKRRLPLLEILPHPHFRLLSKRYLYYNETAAEMERSTDLKIIRPSETLPVSRLTNNMAKIRAIYRMGEKAMSDFLHGGKW